MFNTSVDLLQNFTPQSIYTASDEITMVFRANEAEEDPNNSRIFAGKITKMTTLLSGFVSSRFNYHIKSQITPETTPSVLKCIDQTDLLPS